METQRQQRRLAMKIENTYIDILDKVNDRPSHKDMSMKKSLRDCTDKRTCRLCKVVSAKRFRIDDRHLSEIGPFLRNRWSNLLGKVQTPWNVPRVSKEWIRKRQIEHDQKAMRLHFFSTRLRVWYICLARAGTRASLMETKVAFENVTR